MKALEYSEELFADVMDATLDYFQTGWTVCGAEDPAVILINGKVGEKYPELEGLTTVRVINVYVSPWRSETLLEFSNTPITDEEHRLYEELVDEMEDA